MSNKGISLKIDQKPVIPKQTRSDLAGIAESAFIGLALVLSLWLLVFHFEHTLSPAYVVLSILIFSMFALVAPQSKPSMAENFLNIAIFWCCIFIIFKVIGFFAYHIPYFSKEVIVNWLWVAPASHIGVLLVLRGVFPGLFRAQISSRRTVIVGMNRQGIALARKIEFSPYADKKFLGFFEDRSVDRTGGKNQYRLLGKIGNLSDFVKKHHVQSVYLSLPMTAQPRILEILDALKDTTCSIYFVPDMFITDLIQGRSQSVCGVDVISVCDTPFRGFRGFLKRASDIVLSFAILAVICPLLLLIAALVKASSPGPVIFTQRRYGLDGEQIVV